jgi:LysR family cys regulon transcriptional activator
MTLVQLRYLAAIVDAGLNISLAAQQTHSTQPGLSKQLGQIEDELGFQIFIRRGKRLEALTDLGREVVERAKVILTETANIQTLAANRRKDASGELRIATTPTQARFVLPGILGAMRAKFPEVALHLQASGEAEALERIEQDAADVAIVSSPLPPKTNHLVLPLYRWDLLAFAPQSHPLAGLLRPLQLTDLAGAQILTYESARAGDSSYAQAFMRADMTPAPLAATARDADILKTLVRVGAGVGLLAEMVWTPEDTDLAVLKVNHLFDSRVAWAVLRRDRILRRPILDFITRLAPHLDRQALRAAVDGGRESSWPTAPLWRNLHGPVAPKLPSAPPAPHRAALRLVAGA